MINFTVKEDAGYRLRVESWESIAPKGLISVNFVQECLDKDGKVNLSNTYNYNMTREEISNLCQGLLKL